MRDACRQKSSQKVSLKERDTVKGEQSFPIHSPADFPLPAICQIAENRLPFGEMPKGYVMPQGRKLFRKFMHLINRFSRIVDFMNEENSQGDYSLSLYILYPSPSITSRISPLAEMSPTAIIHDVDSGAMLTS